MVGRAITGRFAKWTLHRKNRDETDLNAMGELFDIGTKYTPRNPGEALRRYMAATGGNPVEASGPLYAKQRIAEMYEDGEGVSRDLDQAARIFKMIPSSPSAMLHFATAHIEGTQVPRDHTEAYRLLLTADKFYSMHPPRIKEVETVIQNHRQNRRHIRVRELMTILEARMSPEQLLKATEAAREWWNSHR